MNEQEFIDTLSKLGATEIKFSIDGPEASLSYVVDGKPHSVGVTCNKPATVADVAESLLRWAKA